MSDARAQLLDRIEQLHLDDEHQQIIALIEAQNDFTGDYDLASLLARAYNNYAQPHMDTYHDLLRRISRAGEITAIVLGALMFAGLAWLVLGQNWENYIISDGTDMYCYYDGETDSVSYVDPLADE